MDETALVVIRYDGRFEIGADGNWGYINGRNKARLIQTKCTYNELLDIVYDATNINRNDFRIKMKFIVRSCYKLDPIEIENDGDVNCFFKDYFRVETMHVSPLFIEVEALQRTSQVGEKDNACVNAFSSHSGSNRPSCSIPTLNVNRSGIRGEEDESGQIRTEANQFVGRSSVNMHNGVDITGVNVVLPTIDEYDRLYNLGTYDVDCQDGIEYEIHDDNLHTDNDVTLENDMMEGDIDDDVLAAHEVPILSNDNLPFVSPDSVVGNVRIAPIIEDTPTIENRHMHGPIRAPPSHSSRSTHEPSASYNHSHVLSDAIEVGQIYANKKELQRKLAIYAMKENFEFKVKKSCSQRFEAKCVFDNCTWRIRATRIEGLELWAIKVFIKRHTCSSRSNCHTDHRQASSRYIGNHIQSKYTGIARQYRPKDIQSDMVNELGVRISYDKAWRAREFILHSIRGTPEESYYTLPLWCSMLESKNPGTITRLETDADGCFLYFFMALGQSIACFNKVRPVVAVYGTHLQGKYKGTLIIASCFDGNEQIYPLAFGIADTENEISYTWFFERFKEAYGEVDTLVFITDRHKGLERAIATVYPNAYHGNCMYHLSCNVKLHFGKNKHVHMAFDQAAKAYLEVDFEAHMRNLEAINIRAHRYVMEARPEKWARAFFPSNRYSIMTTNIAECMNAILRDARSLPIIPLLEEIRSKIQEWFYERRNKAAEATTPVTPWLEKLLQKRLNDCRTFTVTPLSMYEFQVCTFEFSTTVNLESKTCACRQFQLDQYPCIHAIAACRYKNLSPYSYCSEYYSISLWRQCYANTIYPLDDRCLWHAPPEIQQRVVHPPIVRRPPGRPRTRRILSRGEERPQRKCSRCGGVGHNRQTCYSNVPLN